MQYFLRSKSHSNRSFYTPIDRKRFKLELCIFSRKKVMTVFLEKHLFRVPAAITFQEGFWAGWVQIEKWRTSFSEHFELLNVQFSSVCRPLCYFFLKFDFSKKWFLAFPGPGSIEGIVFYYGFEFFGKFYPGKSIFEMTESGGGLVDISFCVKKGDTLIRIFRNTFQIIIRK